MSPEASGADKGLSAQFQSLFGAGGTNLGSPTGGKASRLQQAMAVDFYVHPLQMRRDSAMRTLDMPGEEDGDRRRAYFPQLIGGNLRQHGDPNRSVLHHGCRGPC